MKKRERIKKRVLFNASVILAGFRNPKGGSGRLIAWAKQKRFKAIISQTILSEVLRNNTVVAATREILVKKLQDIFFISSPPSRNFVSRYETKVLDLGEAHVLASTEEAQCQFLVTLDKKHLLVLQKKIRPFRIVSPAQLIESLLQ